MSSNIQPILDRVLAGERMTFDECTTLLESHDIARMGAAADEIRARRHPDNIVTYIIDRNINYTNVCNVVCTFLPASGRTRHLRSHLRRDLQQDRRDDCARRHGRLDAGRTAS